MAAGIGALCILSPDKSRDKGLLLGEDTLERSALHFKVQQLSRGNNGFLCDSNIGNLFYFWLSLTKKRHWSTDLIMFFCSLKTM